MGGGVADGQFNKMDRFAKGRVCFASFFSHMSLFSNEAISFVMGRVGIVVFFLITGLLTPKTRLHRNSVQYAINRIVRMYPTFWVILVLYGLLNFSTVKLTDFFANMTLFNEFLGSHCLIGSSWMMPIQVFFFFVITVLWIPMQIILF